jgi:hypothetical protein
MNTQQSQVLRSINPNNSIIPDIFLSMEVRDEIELLSYVKNGKSGAIFSTIRFNEYIHRTISSTNKANLSPFDSWEITSNGHIRFVKNSKRIIHLSELPRTNSISQSSMNHINSRNRGINEPKPFIEDVRKLSANDKDGDEGEY